MSDELSLPAIASNLAPGGILRAAINFGNPVLAHKDPHTGEPKGVSVAIAKKIADHLKLPLSLQHYDRAGHVFSALEEQAWDLSFLAVDPARAREIAFSTPYVLIEGVYATFDPARYHSPADVDKEGVSVLVMKGSATDLHLLRELKKAQVLHATSSDEFDHLVDRRDFAIYAGVKQRLEAIGNRHPSLAILEQPFMSIPQAVGTPRDRAVAANFLNSFIETLKATGFIEDAMRD